MKKGFIIMLYFIALFSIQSIWGQNLKKEIKQFIKDERLILNNQKTLTFTQKSNCDYYLHNNYISIGFDLEKLMDAPSDTTLRQHRLEEAIDYLQEFTTGTSFGMDTLPMSLEYLIYAYALPNNKVEQIRFNKIDLKSVTLSIYSQASRKRPILFTLQNETNTYIYYFSTILCSTKNMRFR